MRLNDPLTTSISFEGICYPLDLAFDNVLDVLDVLADKSLFDWERIDVALNLTIGENELPTEKQIVLWKEILNDYILLGKSKSVPKDRLGNPLPNSINKKKSVDLVKDAKYIYASFRQIGINLFQEQGKLSWEEFQALLESLPDDAILSRIVQIREWRPSKGDSKEEKERMKLLQAKYSLENESEEVE
ncbi:Gp15 family bacteriophage protein [Enterococcus songbeiensis]|uniref:Gp15 family bacteriophage protein n=1 Tax=Enterococcus songbeiensis TaxID=2559927 RepID=UPI0010F86519|nr:Gp15 family bacteriophage protein [Enterococcus songbeiensis]